MASFWGLMADSCPYFTKEYGMSPNSTWSTALSRFEQSDILRGYRNYLDSGYKGVPSLSLFIDWCKPEIKSACQNPLISVSYSEPTQENKDRAKAVLSDLRSKL